MVRQNPDRDEVIAANGGSDDPRRKYQFYKSGQKLPKTSKVRMRWCSEIFSVRVWRFLEENQKKEKTLKPLRFQGFYGAADQIRTGDLILTKDNACIYRVVACRSLSKKRTDIQGKTGIWHKVAEKTCSILLQAVVS